MIVVTLWRKTLVRHQACEGGLAAFDAIAAMQAGDAPRNAKRLRVTWTPLADVWLRATYPSFSQWMRARNLVPMLTLAGANLRGAKLGGADLCGADLGETDPIPSGWLRDTCGRIARSVAA